MVEFAIRILMVAADLFGLAGNLTQVARESPPAIAVPADALHCPQASEALDRLYCDVTK